VARASQAPLALGAVMYSASVALPVAWSNRSQIEPLGWLEGFVKRAAETPIPGIALLVARSRGVLGDRERKRPTRVIGDRLQAGAACLGSGSAVPWRIRITRRQKVQGRTSRHRLSSESVIPYCTRIAGASHTFRGTTRVVAQEVKVIFPPPRSTRAPRCPGQAQAAFSKPIAQDGPFPKPAPRE